ncbi:uncharacterized protein LOC131010614 [Salvia miltiorrhiza]|uniref:uncharacterized protein LOC131010614 n=1 Tax=Salvia miltiorrhiza TaxID=226208 RepID=UPI0025ACF69F|nr:uncharacterized protein LOC131010614 [Salvia miltiorrhiza]
MAVPILKNLTFLIFKHASNKNVHSSISPVSLHFFSTRTLTQLDINPIVFDILVHKHHFPCEFASIVASKLHSVKKPETVDSMLSFLKSSGFSIAQLQKIVGYDPRFLLLSLERNVKPKINLFQDKGFSSAEIAKIISSCPTILNSSLKNNIIPSLSALKDLLESDTAVVRVVRLNAWILNMRKIMLANVEFLKSCGVSMQRIRIILNNTPGALCHSQQTIRASVEKTKEMGLTVASKPFIYGIQTIASTRKEGWELKLQAFRDMGFSENDISSMFRKEPRAFAVSVEKMKKITEGLVATERFHVSGIVDYPTSLMYSFEKRYKPRIAILRILESRNLIENWPPLRLFSKTSEAKFYERFVRPYMNEVGGVYKEHMKD